MEREQYQDLLKWKENPNKKPLIVFGARQVGKTYLINQFGKENYENVYSINFELEKDAVNIFNGNLDIQTILLQLSAYKPNNPIREKKTLLFFDEAQKCPQILTALKAFALDGRFDVIVSGSMLGIVMHEVSSYPVGYVETMHIRPMSFKEFLLAKGFQREQISILKQLFDEKRSIPQNLHETMNKLFLEYIVVGGMPEAVSTFISNYNIQDVLTVQNRILSDYENDIAKYASKTTREKARMCFESIPDQLAKDNKKYQFKLIKNGGTARTYGNSISWIIDCGIGIRVNRLKTPERPLRAYRDVNQFKLYFLDTGLLLAFYKENVSFDILNGNLGVFKGGIFENVIAQCLLNNGLELYYYQKSDYLEIDFVTYLNSEIMPIEVKSGTNIKATSIKNFMDKNNLKEGIVISKNNLSVNDKGIIFLPLYMSMFLK